MKGIGYNAILYVIANNIRDFTINNTDLTGFEKYTRILIEPAKKL